VIDLVELRHAVHGSGSSVEPRTTDPRTRRLADALRDPRAGPRDLVPLLRQVLRSLSSEVPDPHLDVPDQPGLLAALDATGHVVDRYGGNRLRVRAPRPADLAWLEGRPEWLELATVAPGQLETTAGLISTVSRSSDPVPSDPAFQRVTGHPHHLVPAQRDAVRAAALAPPGSVTHVLLPTGAGKTVVGVLPTLLRPSAQVVVVVPTVAIALDQERAIREASDVVWKDAPPEVAWHGGISQEVRARIRQRLLAGQQRVLFTSPESLVTSLEPTLLAAAQRGHLHTLVVDEAHLIVEWGLDFRPEMQLVASIREQLLEATSIGGHPPVRTVLLTATLDQRALELNLSLFATRGPTQLVGAPALRTEPRFLRYSPTSVDDLDEKLIEVLTVAPRPAIVYATRRAEAERVTTVLREAGFARVESFTGDTDSRSRVEILDAWRGVGAPSRVDVVVGTAAFGLGVDQSDVRTVVHVEAPSSIGSYYQEVGRSGRDGHAAVAVLLAPRWSLETNLNIGDATLLRDETILRRWRAMRTTYRDGDPPTVDVRVLPENINRASDANELWNKNALILMERAGLIRTIPPPLPPSADDDAWEKRRGRIGVDFRVDDLSDEAIARGVEEVRTSHLNSRRSERSAVRALLDGDTCFGQHFASAYTFEVTDRTGTTLRARPPVACSGCPGCMRPGLPAVDPPTAFLPPAVLHGEVAASLSELAGGGRLLVLHDEPDWLHRQGPALMRKLIAAGCRHVFVERPDRRLAKTFSDEFVAVDRRPGGLHRFPDPSVVWDPKVVDQEWRSAPGSLRVIVVTDEVVAPERRDEALHRWWSPTRRARDVMELI
jgi:ATP-dependent DNA helicase RecQ